MLLLNKFTLLQYCNKFTVMQIKLVVVVMVFKSMIYTGQASNQIHWFCLLATDSQVKAIKLT